MDDGLPVIPLSPITRRQLQAKCSKETAEHKLTALKRRKSSNLAQTRRLLEDIAIASGEESVLEEEVAGVEGALLTSWDSNQIARQISIIDTRLFAACRIDKTLLLASDKVASRFTYLIDFARYLSHSFAHIIISEGSDTANESSKSVLAHVIYVCHLLLHVYRDYNGFAALFKTLKSPEVQRLTRQWDALSNRQLSLYKELAPFITSRNLYAAYQHHLSRKTAALQAESNGTRSMLSVPWMPPLFDELHLIATSYTSTPSEHSVSMLAPPGARKLSRLYSLLLKCQTGSTSKGDDAVEDDVEEQPLSPRPSGLLKRRATSTKPLAIITAEDTHTRIEPILDLSLLGDGDRRLHHWLLSRCYLTKEQLVMESLEVVPLRYGEEVLFEAGVDNVPDREEHVDIADMASLSSRTRSSLDILGRPHSSALSELDLGPPNDDVEAEYLAFLGRHEGSDDEDMTPAIMSDTDCLEPGEQTQYRQSPDQMMPSDADTGTTPTLPQSAQKSPPTDETSHENEKAAANNIHSIGDSSSQQIPSAKEESTPTTDETELFTTAVQHDKLELSAINDTTPEVHEGDRKRIDQPIGDQNSPTLLASTDDVAPATNIEVIHASSDDRANGEPIDESNETSVSHHPTDEE